MGSRGQSGRDRDARNIVGEYNLDSIGENKGKILKFFRDMDGTDERDLEDRFRQEASTLSDELSESMVYRDDELRDMFPGRFPRSITNPADQLQQINRVLGSLRNQRVVAASEDDKEAAAPYIYDSLARAYNEIRRRKGRRSMSLGRYESRRSGTYGGGSRYSFGDDDELPFF